MVDYDKSTGSTGLMRIKDTGTYVEFWLKASSYTYNYQLPWGYKVNGVTDTNNSFRFESSGSWQRLGRWNVTTDQTVTFYLYDSGTSGLGGPTTLSAAIQRSSAPDRPDAPRVDYIVSTEASVFTNDNSSNGISIDTRQIAYGKTYTASTTIVSSDGSTRITGLAPKTLYYAKSRAHNAKGWSPWSPTKAFRTIGPPPAPEKVFYENVTQTSFTVWTKTNGDGGSPVDFRQYGYSMSATSAPTTISNSIGPNAGLTYSGMSPGATYYFWAREHNSEGWGAWSVRSYVILPASFKMNVNGTWEKGVVYVRYNGVWRVAQPLVKIAGMWKPTS